MLRTLRWWARGVQAGKAEAILTDERATRLEARLLGAFHVLGFDGPTAEMIMDEAYVTVGKRADKVEQRAVAAALVLELLRLGCRRAQAQAS
jgi:hypothetical protein